MPKGMRMRQSRRSLAVVLLSALVGFASWAGAEEDRVGTTVFARGAATAALENDVRLIGQGMPIFRHDVLTTGRDSFAVVELNDGTRMSLRPNTVMRVDEYADGEGEERMQLQLFQGGMRTVTGQVADREPDAFALLTPVATLGVLGTDFSARLCEQDCAEEARSARRRRRRRSERRRASRVREGRGERGIAVRQATRPSRPAVPCFRATHWRPVPAPSRSSRSGTRAG